MKKWIMIIATVVLTFSGCAKIGNEFDAGHVKEINIGKTTQRDIINMFGQPWRIGLEDGVVMWTYGRYTYRVIGDTDTKDLVVKFDNNKVVSSYTFNETVKRK